MVFPRVRRYAAEHDIRILNSTGYKADLVGHVATRRLNVRHVVTIQGFVEKYPLRKRFYDVLTRWVARRADRVVTVSDSLKRDLVRGGTREDRIVTVHNFVDARRFENVDPAAVARVRRELGVAPGAPCVQILGRLNPEKGHTHFLEAAARVKKELPGVRYVVVGESYRSLRQQLERRAAELGVQRDVVFTGYREDVPALLAAATVVVSASLREGLPLVLVEAMAAARPVVATTVDGIPELVDPGRTGLLVPPRDAEGLAAGMLKMLRAPEQAAAMGRAGRAVVRERFSAEQMVRRIQDVYGSLL